MTKFKEGDIIDVPMRVFSVGASIYRLQALDEAPQGIGIYCSFIDAHARPSDYGKAQSEPLPPAETPIAVGDVVRLRSASWPSFTVDSIVDGKAQILALYSSGQEPKLFVLRDVPLACLKKDSD